MEHRGVAALPGQQVSGGPLEQPVIEEGNSNRLCGLLAVHERHAASFPLHQPDLKALLGEGEERAVVRQLGLANLGQQPAEQEEAPVFVQLTHGPDIAG